MIRNWECPWCSHSSVLTTGRNISEDYSETSVLTSEGLIGFITTSIVCMNPTCQKYTLRIEAYDVSDYHLTQRAVSTMRSANLLYSRVVYPSFSPKSFPEYVPQAIRNDYEEAQSIVELSPKSAATLIRRAIQGVIRDFYNIRVKGNRLIDEINALEKDSIGSEVLSTLHQVREIGNVGAHMEEDVNLIIDILPEEAMLLVEVLESMVEDTYIKRDRDRQRMELINQKAIAIKEQKKGGVDE